MKLGVLTALFSDQPLEKVRSQMDTMLHAVSALGTVVDDPFMLLSFLALPVIPELKITDRGLFDVTRFAHVPLFKD